MAFLLLCCADAAWCTKAAKCIIPWRAPPCVCRGRRNCTAVAAILAVPATVLQLLLLLVMLASADATAAAAELALQL